MDVYEESRARWNELSESDKIAAITYSVYLDKKMPIPQGLFDYFNKMCEGEFSAFDIVTRFENE